MSPRPCVAKYGATHSANHLPGLEITSPFVIFSSPGVAAMIVSRHKPFICHATPAQHPPPADGIDYRKAVSLSITTRHLRSCAGFRLRAKGTPLVTKRRVAKHHKYTTPSPQESAFRAIPRFLTTTLTLRKILILERVCYVLVNHIVSGFCSTFSGDFCGFRSTFSGDFL